MKNRVAAALFPILLIGFGGCNSEKSTTAQTHALYGDYESSKVFNIDVDRMSLDAVLDVSPALGPYGVDRETDSEAFALTRRSDSIAVVRSVRFDTQKRLDRRRELQEQ